MTVHVTSMVIILLDHTVHTCTLVNCVRLPVARHSSASKSPEGSTHRARNAVRIHGGLEGSDVSSMLCSTAAPVMLCSNSDTASTFLPPKAVPATVSGSGRVLLDC